MNRIIEMIFQEEDPGVMAISIVDDPAIEENFIYFANKKTDRYIYTLKPEYIGDEMVIDTSHNLCKKFAKGDAVSYSDDTIRGWSRYTNYTKWGFKDTAFNFLRNFPLDGVDLGSGCMFGCRHMLKKKIDYHKTFNFQMEFKKADKRRISGPIMVGNHLMYRPKEDLDGKDDGYVYFCNHTVEKLQKHYGIKASTTLLHRQDISQNVIMTKSWMDKSDPKHWKWMGEYYIISDFIWDSIQNGSLQGFSVEISCSPVFE
jgi:hypothetical protein